MNDFPPFSKINLLLFCCVFLWQYYHSVRVFAGQDPASVWVGFVTPDYHYHCKNFGLSRTQTVTVTLGDERGRVHERQATCLLISGVYWMSERCIAVRESQICQIV